ncbi:unnamed protein product [Pleuronectes platessa]|uniref:Uncharacterized protein n=1 Tax=Pleuronectes platessa TaxID=8262 RepID=A0A9N7V439_PLEPL|nr:unnamed protein product [Pleuronectes platessa]
MGTVVQIEVPRQAAPDSWPIISAENISPDDITGPRLRSGLPGCSPRNGVAAVQPAACPGSNRVVNSIRFCFLWTTLDGWRGRRSVGDKEGGSKTLVSPVSSPSITRERGAREKPEE